MPSRPYPSVVFRNGEIVRVMRHTAWFPPFYVFVFDGDPPEVRTAAEKPVDPAVAQAVLRDIVERWTAANKAAGVGLPGAQVELL